MLIDDIPFELAYSEKIAVKTSPNGNYPINGYKNMQEWYHPEIDYHEMIKKFRITESAMSRALHTKPPFGMFSMSDYSGHLRMDETRDQQMFQFWNKQFNDELVKVINLITKLNKPKLILDVCAGDGTLVNILLNRGFDAIGADNYEWPFNKRYCPPQKMDYREALKKYRPDFVIGCWMPLWTNWTYSFRRIKSVQHYMIIGESEGGCCGGEWIERKGWNMRYHDEATKYALCRTDYIWTLDSGKLEPDHHSKVYTFSRL